MLRWSLLQLSSGIGFRRFVKKRNADISAQWMSLSPLEQQVFRDLAASQGTYAKALFRKERLKQTDHEAWNALTLQERRLYKSGGATDNMSENIHDVTSLVQSLEVKIRNELGEFPNAKIKKPVSPFALFSEEHKISGSGSAEYSALWKALPETEKEKYREKALRANVLAGISPNANL